MEQKQEINEKERKTSAFIALRP